ncbi:MAG: phage tail tape measure protein [Butyrivibrio sp.]|nr:phage tail tape measure protein [Muribaculum sp.]MCM1551230.1 phage tail tape measure protein [Butyrivibrio sp.]
MADSGMVEVAKATVTIIPNMKGAQKKISSDLGIAMDGAAESAGKSAGGKIASAIGSGLKAGVAAIGAGMAAATTGVVAFGKSSVEAGMSFDASMSQVAATMGVTVDEIEDLRVFAQEMGASTAFSASQAADALNYMALAGYDADTSMAMLPNVLNLAAAGGIELASASDMVTDAQSALGLSIEETSELVDIMAKTSSKSNTSIAQLGEAILTVGGTAKNLAGGTTELSTALGILADNGVKGAEGGTALRNIILSLSAPTDKAAELMESLGIRAYDMSGNLKPLNETFEDLNNVLSTMSQQEQTNVLNTMFNKVDLKSVNALLANTAVDFDSLAQSIKAAGVNLDKYEENNWSCRDSLNGMNSVLGEMQRCLAQGADDMEEMAEFYANEYDLDVDDALIMLNEMSKSLGDTGSRWNELEGYIDDAEGAAQKMADTQLDNLAGDVTLFQSALEGAQIVVSDQLTPSLREFVQFGADGLSEITESFKENGLEGAMDTFGELLGEGVSMIVEKLPDVVDAGAQVLTAFGEGIMENLPLLTDTGIEIMETLLTFILSNLPGLVGAGMVILTSLASGIADAIPELVPVIIDTVMEIGNTIIENLPLLLEATLQIILALSEGLLENIDNIVDGVVGLLIGMVDFVIENLPMFIEAAIEIVMAINEGLFKALPDLLVGFLEICYSLGEALNEVDWISLGINIIEGIINGLDSMRKAVLETIVDIASSAWQGIKDFFGIASPSKLMMWAGEMVGTGLIEGVEGTEPKLDQTMQDVGAIVGSGMAEGAAMVSEADIPQGESDNELVANVHLEVEGDGAELLRVIKKEAKIEKKRTDREVVG